MKNVPQKIYLQIDADGETPEDFNELYPSLDVSWCTDKIHPNDIEYTLSNEGEEAIGTGDKIQVDYQNWIDLIRDIKAEWKLKDLQLKYKLSKK